MLAAAKGRLRHMNLPWALATGVSIAAYTVVDGIGVRASGNWLGYTGGDFRVLHRRAAVVSGAKPERGFSELPPNEAGKAVGGGLISLAAYGAIIWAMQSSPMGAVSALRETSVVFAALLGAAFLGERLTAQRIAACCIIAAGAACVGWTVLSVTVTNEKRPGAGRGVLRSFARDGAEAAQSFLRKPENFFWNRDTRPPRSSSCWAPPVQAGCDLESMSRFSLSPSLPQVERVWYSVPSVITTVIV